MNPLHVGSAHSGLREWLVQRLSALYMAGFIVYLVLRFSLSPVTAYEDWIAWFSSGGVRIATALFFANSLVHAWIGMRSVYLDYVKPLSLRFAISALTAFALLALALWLAGVLLIEGRV